MNEDIRVGLEIQSINNGYLLTGHKTNGYQGADTGKIYFANFDELANALVDTVRKSFDLNILPDPNEQFSFASFGGLN